MTGPVAGRSLVMESLESREFEKLFGKGGYVGTLHFMLFHRFSTIFIKIAIFRNFDFPNEHVLDLSKLKEFADDNLKFDQNGRKLSKRKKKKLCRKSRNCLMQAMSPFPTVFSKKL